MTIRVPRFTQDCRGVMALACGDASVRVDWATATEGRDAADQAARALETSRGWPAGGARSVRFHHSAADEKVLLSRTHTSNLGMVASVDRVASAAASVLSLGVDVERADRVLRPGIERHYLNAEDDAHWRNSLLRAWVAKEAAFKALSVGPDEPVPSMFPVVLSGLWVRANAFGCVGYPACGEVVVTAEMIGHQPVLLGLAVRQACGETLSQSDNDRGGG